MGKYLLIVGILLGFCATGRANTLPEYNITGALTVVGNDACNGLCAETITFSFDTTLEDIGPMGIGQDYYWPYVIPGTNTFLSSGPLDFSSMGLNFIQGEDYLPFFDAGGDEIDIFLGENPETAPFVPTLSGADFYGCKTETCQLEFCTECNSPAAFNAIPSGFKLYGALESITTLITPVPEPSTEALLLIGLFSLAVLTAYRSRKRRLWSVRPSH
jgi:hypothetical protein